MGSQHSTHNVQLAHSSREPGGSVHYRCQDCDQHFFQFGKECRERNRIPDRALFVLETDDLRTIGCGEECKASAVRSVFGQVAQPRPCRGRGAASPLELWMETPFA